MTTTMYHMLLTKLLLSVKVGASIFQALLDVYCALVCIVYGTGIQSTKYT